MDLKTFLWSVITSEAGWFCLSHATVDKDDWKEEWFGWPDDIERILARVEQLREDHNVYFSPYLFTNKRATKENAIVGRTIVADLDEANILTVPIKPTILVETSPERHQGYWILKNEVGGRDEHESLSKRLTYAIPRCDRTGWFIGKKVRVPGTYNFKYSSGRKAVRVADNLGKQYDQFEFDLLPQIPFDPDAKTEEDSSWVEEAEALDIGPQELLATLRTKLPSRVVATYNREERDRSAALWALMTAAFRAGASREQVYHLARHSANNKFADLKYGGKRELAKDVLRAEATVNSKAPDTRAKILEARRLPGLASEKRAYIAQLVIRQLAKLGQFINCADGSAWYVREDIGKPIAILNRSEQLTVLLDTMFGINATEPESSFCTSALISYASQLVPTGNMAALSYYDSDTQTVFLHTGRRDVLKITKDSIETVVNGYQDILFPWDLGADILNPNYAALERPWYEVLFDGCLDNLVGMSKEEAYALLRAWLIMLVLRAGVVSRPILALFGQPGAGKSTLFRRIYVLLYGKQKSLNAVTTAEDFDYAVSSSPLVVLDNVDTWERWLPDRLALAAAASDLTKRKLYTNADVVTLKRQALLGITAHNPKFGREDVTDRLILLTFERLQHFKPETDILNYIQAKRNALWGAILKDIQTVLSTPLPRDEDVPQFRVEDFSRMGYWITSALGGSEHFVSAIESLRKEQRAFSLEEDHILLECLHSWIQRSKEPEEWRTPGQLWSLLEGVAKDPQAFSKQYRNAVSLGKKLWSLQDSLKAVYEVEWKYDPVKGSRAWRFSPKEGSRNGRV